MERWKANDKYPGLEISDQGNVKNWRGHMLKSHKKKGWCYVYWLDPERDKFRVAPVHVMVAETFLDNPKGYRWVRHRNRNKSDNRASNLAWTLHRNGPAPKNKEKPNQVKYDRTALGDLKEMDSNGAIALFNAICNRAIDDLAKVQKATDEKDVTAEDVLGAEDARDFFEREIYKFGVDLNKKDVLAAVAKRIRERNEEKKKDPVQDYEKLPKWKKKCERCKYRTYFPDANADPHARRHTILACGYILATGHSKPCRGEHCTVYEKGDQLKLDSGFAPISLSRGAIY